MSGEPALTDQALATVLGELPHWRRDGHTMVRTETASTFPAAIAWVVATAQIAEAMNHHPDIDIRYRQVTWRLSTHSVGAITELDVALARRIDAVVDL
jgi:4a-hydroxytetrahydrobiopterin dehydratase